MQWKTHSLKCSVKRYPSLLQEVSASQWNQDPISTNSQGPDENFFLDPQVPLQKEKSLKDIG